MLLRYDLFKGQWVASFLWGRGGGGDPTRRWTKSVLEAQASREIPGHASLGNFENYLRLYFMHLV